jgi:hypothetical protein
LANEVFLTAIDTCQPILFTTLSWSGREATEDLCRLVIYQRRQRGTGAKPIVAIGTVSRKSAHGPYDAPSFKIEGWVGAEEAPSPAASQLSQDLAEHLGAKSAILGSAQTTAPVLPQPRRRRKPDPAPWDRDDLDDEIPQLFRE